MDLGLAMVVMALLVLGALALLVLALYWVIRLGVRHGTGDAHRRGLSAPPDRVGDATDRGR